MSSITEFYERYDEENRLTIDNARKIEFNVTTTILNEQIEPHYRILELGAGAGAYSFYYAEKGNEVVSGVMANLKQFLTHTFIDEVLSSGVTKEGGSDCFLNVGFFTSPTEIELFIRNFNIEIVDHVATDGICALLRNQINELNDEQYETWMNYMLSSCREKSILGISNHGLLLCKKN